MVLRSQRAPAQMKCKRTRFWELATDTEDERPCLARVSAWVAIALERAAWHLNSSALHATYMAWLPLDFGCKGMLRKLSYVLFLPMHVACSPPP